MGLERGGALALVSAFKAAIFSRGTDCGSLESSGNSRPSASTSRLATFHPVLSPSCLGSLAWFYLLSFCFHKNPVDSDEKEGLKEG